MTPVLLTLPWDKSVWQVFSFWPGTQPVFCWSRFQEEPDYSELYYLSHPQTEEVDGEEEESKTGFLELYSTHCVGTGSTQGN